MTGRTFWDFAAENPNVIGVGIILIGLTSPIWLLCMAGIIGGLSEHFVALFRGWPPVKPESSVVIDATQHEEGGDE